jgi:hypothetical protein
MAIDGPMHDWFGLSYASYLVLPRSLIQEMPPEWQQRLVDLLDEMGREFPGMDDEYQVLMRDAGGRFREDPLRGYRRPDVAALAKARRRWLIDGD